MTLANKLLLLGAALALASSARAGPCNTASHDAGSGNVPGHTRQATGPTATDSKDRPPTSAAVAEQSRQPEPAPNQQPRKMRGGAGTQHKKKKTRGGGQKKKKKKKR